MSWTERQEQAIYYNENKDLLVAAAAGAGKTSVMVERVINLVLTGKAGMDELLVVTFTKAAASSMKEKIISSLRAKVQEDPKRIRQQLSMVQDAAISTFDSFAQTLVKENFQVIDIDPSARVLDETKAVLVKNQALDELFEEKLIQARPDFVAFLNSYSEIKSLEGVRAIILSLYDKLMALPDPWGKLDEAVERTLMEEEAFMESPAGKLLISEVQRKAAHARNCLECFETLIIDSALTDMKGKLLLEVAYYKKAIEQLEGIDSATSFDQAGRSVAQALENGVKLLRGNKTDKPVLELIKPDIERFRNEGYKKDFKDLISTYFYQPLHSSIEEIKYTHGFAKVVAELVKGFADKYMSLKSEQGAYDFSDFMHFALKVLKEESVANGYKNRFKYIFVDEYQDSNELQEELISRISRGGNIFMVGDVKQSIYRFRQAEPAIFRERYINYKDNLSEGRVIDLNANFRSKVKVIEAINTLFESIMDGYDEEARLKPGNAYEGEYNYKPEIYLVDRTDESERTTEDSEEDIKNKAELEAYNIAALIEKMVEEKKLINSAGVDRPVEFRDIVILMNSTKSAGPVFQDVFEREGIPVYVERREGYFDAVEIAIMLNLLRVIDNTMQDIPLISVLFSSIFGFSSQELAMIRLANKEREASFYDAFMCCVNSSETALEKKCSRAYERIQEWKRESNTMSLSDFIWLLYRETGFYIYAGALKGGDQRQTNLRMLVNKAISYSMESSGIYGFINEIENLKDRKYDEPPATTLGEDADAVRIMTIHKSKGLEFPVVILAGAEKNLNLKNEDSSVLFNKELGLAPNYVSKDCKWKKKTLLQLLIKSGNEIEEKREKVRLLYVAFTRAIDWLIISGVTKEYARDNEKWQESYPLDPIKALEGGTFLDWIMPVLGKRLPLTITGKQEIIERAAQGEDNTGEGVYEKLEQYKHIEVRKEIADKLSFVYPYLKDTKIKSKYSVSELNGSASIGDTALNLPAGLRGDEKVKLDAGEKGTIYHLIMEHIDFTDLNRANPDEILKELVNKGRISEDEAAQVWTGKIRKFLKSDLAKRMSRAALKGRLHRETSFTLKTDLDGSEALVQGIIDCFFEEDEGCVLVDYKSNRIYEKNEETFNSLRETYREQINLYDEAITRIMGKNISERYLFLLDIGESISI